MCKYDIRLMTIVKLSFNFFWLTHCNKLICTWHWKVRVSFFAIYIYIASWHVLSDWVLFEVNKRCRLFLLVNQALETSINLDVTLDKFITVETGNYWKLFKKVDNRIVHLLYYSSFYSRCKNTSCIKNFCILKPEKTSFFPFLFPLWPSLFSLAVGSIFISFVTHCLQHPT